MNYFTAKYTVVLKDLLDNELTKAKIETALSSYPLYEKKSEEKYIPSMVPTRKELNNKILNYYKYREIGFETVGRFIDELEISMNEIMPYYNQLFFAADQDYDILYNVDYVKEITTNKNAESSNNVTENGSTSNNSTDIGTSSSTGTNTSEASDETTTSATVNNYNKSVKSGTPQDSLAISNVGIDTVSYADELGFSHDTNSDSGTSTGASTTESTSSLSGNSSNTSSSSGTNTNEITSNGTNAEEEKIIEKTLGNYGAMSTQRQVQEYIDIIRNIEQEIINDPRIQELFMLIY